VRDGLLCKLNKQQVTLKKLKGDLSKTGLAGDKFLVAFITKPVTPLFHTPIFLYFLHIQIPCQPVLTAAVRTESQTA